MSSTLSAGLIGCGFFATNHLHAWRDIAGLDVTAICDQDPARLAAVGDRFGIARRYTDAAAMLAAEELGFVDIVTTVPSHRSLVELAARHRLPVICQKPFAATMADARAMVDACTAAGVPLMVHENHRWQSQIRQVRAILDRGEIGMPFWGRVSFRSGYDIVSGQPYLAEGERFILEDLGIHALDVARFLFGEVSSLAARTNRVNPAVKGEDAAAVLLSHRNGATSVVDVSYATKRAPDPFPETIIEVDGSEGSIRLSQSYRLAVTSAAGTRESDASPPLLPWAGKPWHGVQDSVRAIQQHWVDCLRTGREPDTSGRDNLRSTALVEAAYASAAGAGTVDPARF